MPDYAVYGGLLRSTIPIPELRPLPDGDSTRTPNWSFDVASGEVPSMAQAAVVGQDEIFDQIQATFFRGTNALRLQFDDTGTFDLWDDARVIVWYPKDGCQPDVARADLVGRVLPLAQHERGLIALHASAVCLPAGTIAFMAPKNYGKSSLAMSLVTEHQAQLLTDDTLIVSPGRGVAVPGVHSVRLWGETARRFEGLGRGRPVLSEKEIFEDLPQTSLAMQESPLVALYTIVPEEPQMTPVVRREALDGAHATIALIQYQKLGALLGGPDAAQVFDRAAALAARCPVYALHIARDWARLPEAARVLADWHAR